MQIVPSSILTAIIKHYLFLDSDGFGPNNLRLFTDGNTGIVFTSGSSLTIAHKNHKLPDTFLYGQITQFKDLCLSAKAHLIIVVFRPAGMKKLLGIPGVELRESIISLRDIFGNLVVKIEEKLAEAATAADKATILNDFFISRTVNNLLETEQIVDASVNFILKNKGLVSNNELVKFTGYTERHIERLFQRSIGINPKNFSSIIKLHNFLQQLKNQTDKISLTKIAYQAGYADQSHLIREFRKHTGITPTQYKHTTRLANNFLALPSRKA